MVIVSKHKQSKTASHLTGWDWSIDFPMFIAWVHILNYVIILFKYLIFETKFV
jgi:hypothetical protein